MANENNVGIQMSIEFEPYAAVEVKLQKLMKQLQSNNKLNVILDQDSFNKLQSQFDSIKKQLGMENVNINTTQATNSLNNLNVTAEKTKAAIQSITSGTSFSNSHINTQPFSELQNRVEEIKASVDKLANYKIKLDTDGNIESALITYKDDIGNIVNETMAWVTTQKEVNNELVKTQSFKTTGYTVGASPAKEESAALKDAISLLNQQYNLENQISIAKEKQLTNTEATLIQQRDMIKASLDTAKSTLSDENLVTLKEKENQLIQEQAIQEAKVLDLKRLQTEETQKQIVQTQTDYTRMLANLQTKYGSLLNSGDLPKQIQTFRDNLNNLTTDNFNKGTISTEFKQIESNVKASSSALRIATQDAQSFGKTIISDATKFGLIDSPIYQ